MENLFSGPTAIAFTEVLISFVTVPNFGLGIKPFGPKILPSFPIFDIVAGVAISLSKFIFPFVISLTKLSNPAISAPESFASLILFSSQRTATFTFFPFPFGKFTKVLKLISSFFCFKFNKQETSIDSLNLAVQSLLTFLITSSIISGLFSLDASSNFLYLFDRFDLINLLPQYP